MPKSIFRKFRNSLLGALMLSPAPVAAQPVDALTALIEPPRFTEEIAAFAAQDLAAPPAACPVLFVGSSSIRMWRTLSTDMAPMPVLNRGFGGAHITDVNRHFDEVVGRYGPRAIVFYAGENDLAAGRSPEQVTADFQAFLDLKSAALGSTPVFFTSLKPSYLRRGQFEAQSQVNAAVRALAESREDLHYLDVVPLMMPQGELMPVFLPDGLHLAPEGYALWTAAIGDALRQAGADTLACGSQTAFSPDDADAPG